MVERKGNQMGKINTEYLKPHLFFWGVIYLGLAWIFTRGEYEIFWIVFTLNLIRHAVGEMLAIKLIESVNIGKTLAKTNNEVANEILKTTNDNLRLIEINKDLIRINEDLIQRLKNEND